MEQLLDDFRRVTGILLPVFFVVLVFSGACRVRNATIGASARNAAVDAALVYSGLCVAYLVFSPQPQCRTAVELEPGADLLQALGSADDPLPWIQLVGNGVLLLPLAALAPLRVRLLDSVPKIALAGLLISVGIELSQYLFVVGRTTSTDDVLLNTAGAVLGGFASRAPVPRRAVARGPKAVSAVDTRGEAAVGAEREGALRTSVSP